MSFPRDYFRAYIFTGDNHDCNTNDLLYRQKQGENQQEE
jgi:hypothetical protein